MIVRVHVHFEIPFRRGGIVAELTLIVLDLVMHCLDMTIQESLGTYYMGAFENLFWFWRAPFWFRSPNDALFITVVTYAPTRIILRPVGRSNFEYLLVNPVLPHVQDILVNCPLMLKQILNSDYGGNITV